VHITYRVAEGVKGPEHDLGCQADLARAVAGPDVDPRVVADGLDYLYLLLPGPRPKVGADEPGGFTPDFEDGILGLVPGNCDRRRLEISAHR
jgi:hypothetical protein